VVMQGTLERNGHPHTFSVPGSSVPFSRVSPVSEVHVGAEDAPARMSSVTRRLYGHGREGPGDTRALSFAWRGSGSRGDAHPSLRREVGEVQSRLDVDTRACAVAGRHGAIQRHPTSRCAQGSADVCCEVVTVGS